MPISTRPLPSRERLQELFSYDPAVGVFTHKRRRCGAKHGDVAGVVDKDGHRKIKIDGKYYFAHLCAWMWVYGVQPKDEIDHRNGMPGENWISNLREATRSQNKANCRAKRGTFSGLKGVTRQNYGKQGWKWRAQICKDGQRHYLGWYDTAEEAHERYVSVAREFFGEFASDGKQPRLAA